MNKIILIVLFMLSASFFIFGQAADKNSKAEREAAKINEEFDKAIVSRDAAAYERILADDFIFTSSDGMVTDKAQELAKVKSGDLKFESAKSDDVRVKIFGKTAIVTGRYTAKGTSKGKDFTFAERYTAVFVKRNGRWQMVSEHASEIVQK